MTLTLDEVRRIRFPMARRPGDGYRAAEVDDFVDRVDATFAAMTDESERLKAQLEALKSSDDRSQYDEPDSELAEEIERLKAQLEEARAAQRSRGDEARTVKRYESELTQLRNENARLNSQLSDARRELATARSATEAPATSQLVGDGKVERIEV
ncbi:DivIVA domain-containing protein, partial [Cutibacterium granulosum]